MTIEARQKSRAIPEDVDEAGRNRPRDALTNIDTVTAATRSQEDAAREVAADEAAADEAGGAPSGATSGPRSCCCWPTSQCTATS